MNRYEGVELPASMYVRATMSTFGTAALIVFAICVFLLAWNGAAEAKRANERLDALERYVFPEDMRLGSGE